jgi:hypothetical protein
MNLEAVEYKALLFDWDVQSFINYDLTFARKYGKLVHLTAFCI